jgi:hypothetical protein
MQLTPFDRWLLEVFVYETHIQTLSPAESIPKGIRAVELPDSPMQRYRYLYIARKSSDAEVLIQQLRENTQMFATEIVERKNWYNPIIAPKDKSFTWRVLSTAVMVSSTVAISIWVYGLIKNPDVRAAAENWMELIK